jgi:putative ABC transport system substrate-binding protein
MNNRRKLVIALGTGALALPFAPFAQQQGKLWRVGVLFLLSRQSAMDTGRYSKFLEGMRELGYIGGKNLMIEPRFADGKSERLPSLALELVNLKVDVIVTAGTAASSAAQNATTTIPIVIANAANPVGSGLVKNLAHPGGNLTGLSSLNTDISPKYLEMLQGMVPKLSRVALMIDPDNSSHTATRKGVMAAAQRASIKIVLVEARTPQEIEKAFSVIAREKAGAVIVASDSFFVQQLRQIAELLAKYRLPSISARREYAEAGFLMSYGESSADNFRRAATYVDKILKGAMPGDLPVEQPTKFELVINGKTAKTLGLKIPQSLLIMVDKVIE